jgi:hypothetical protein
MLKCYVPRRKSVWLVQGIGVNTAGENAAAVWLNGIVGTRQSVMESNRMTTWRPCSTCRLAFQ